MSRDPKYSKKFVERWAIIKKKGRMSFMLQQGLVVGTILFLVFRIYRSFSDTGLAPLLSETTLISWAMFVTINMILWGTLAWNLNNIKYRRMLQMEQEGKTS